ncbi:ATP-dependent zinc protease family protein [Alteromonas lipotrueiana]|uniref:ATP-dependent zinc protease family protein n=1 Tax=Alteromonas lipotrueiana TaxID=2803815 RepID=UPI001C47824F|nr:RimK/LysX family protein [Alteromonas lipotrueiana]|tara:strand:+ start:242 stop:679 length:438 start_codon:yes stop_codon:yes gene_type:complete
MTQSDSKQLVGALETCDLPALAIEALHIRVDTGATTSSLHVDNLEEFEEDDQLWVSFDIHPDIHNVNRVIRRKAPVLGKKRVKSSTATRERRYVIQTPMVLGGERWDIQLTLTDRSEMTYLMLLGREAMAGRVIVDPEHEYLLKK